MAMVTEQGIIQYRSSRKALVRIQKSSHCATCESRGACHVVSNKEMLIEVVNDLQAEVGDHVEISVPTTSLLKLSVFVYFLPIVALLVGAYLGGEWARIFRTPSPLTSIVGGGCAMGITFYILRRLDRKEQRKGRYQPHITRILSNAASRQRDDSK